MKKKYLVYDTTGTVMRAYDSWKEAYAFCVSVGRLDWKIK